jgi:ABC-2 type transport system ATP-binding protein
VTATASARGTRLRPVRPDPAPGTPAVSLRDVTMTYQGASAPSVDRLSLEIPTGTIFGLLGPNGAGKSTTIGMITDLAVPSAGEVMVFGLPPRLAKADFGVVDQDTALLKPLSVEYNLRYAARLYGYWGRECRRRVEAGLRLARLEDFARARAGTLSGGMARRLAIACALVHEPRLVILDEPTAGVDPGERAMLWDHIRALADQGRTILLTTHLLDEAEALCGQVVIMRSGRIAAGPETPGALRRAYGGQTVTVRAVANEQQVSAALAEIRAIDGVRRADAARAPDGAHEVTVTAAARDGIAGRVVTILAGHGVGIADVDTQDAGLDEVFLRLTGFKDDDRG